MKDKNNKEIENLIGSLSDDLSPVKKMCNLWVSIIPWIVLTLIYSAVMIFVLGLRFDIENQLKEPEFLFEIVLSVALIITSVIASALLMCPDMRGHKWFLSVPVVLLLVLIAKYTLMVTAYGLYMPTLQWYSCVDKAGILGGLPVIVMLLFVRRGHTTHPKWMAFMNILSVGGVGWIGLRLVCASDSLGHNFMYHLAPFIIFGLLLSALARRLYRW